jgi:GT2 family glycosyltransferase
MPAPTAAVLICTRNRVEDLARTLRSITAVERPSGMMIVIVDASDEAAATANQRTVQQLTALDVAYHRFRGVPAGTRQRNYGVDCLPRSIEMVHLIDDDVIVLPGYFYRLSQTLSQHPDAGGVGGLIIEKERPRPARPHGLQRLFLLSSRRPGRVLPSGHASGVAPNSGLHRVEWLSSCASSYRRDVFDTYRFDPSVEGRSPRLEDLDFSYRVGQSRPLLAEPRAQLVHCPSASHRRDAIGTAAESVPRRYWFMEKNIRHPLRKPAFWWATFGQLLAAATSSASEKSEVLRGLWHGIRSVWTRDHPLLARPQSA